MAAYNPLSFLIYSHVKSGNAEFAFDLAMWTFKQKGVLRVSSVDHHLVGATSPPADYTIEDNVVRMSSNYQCLLNKYPKHWKNKRRDGR